MKLHWDIRHQNPTSLLWKLGCHGNQSETAITYIPSVNSISCIEFIFGIKFLKVAGISHLTGCFEI